MKKTLIALATTVALAASIPAAMAQPGYGPGYGTRGGPDGEYMAKVLDLTPEQQAKMKTLFEEQAKKREQMRAEMRTEMQGKLQGILTKEQYNKMVELRELRMRHRHAMGPGGRGPGWEPGNCPGMGPGARHAE